jgi:HK97 family phage major capsid protein
MIGSGLNQPGSNNPPMSILGIPLILTEKVPTLGTTGDIALVDLSYYLIGDRQQMETANSEHFLFNTDKMAFRVIERLDGQPWLQSAITPHSNSANTLTAFVQLATR